MSDLPPSYQSIYDKDILFPSDPVAKAKARKAKNKAEMIAKKEAKTERIRQRNTDLIVNRARQEADTILARLREYTDMNLTQRERDRVEHLTTFIRDAEDEPDVTLRNERIRSASGILQGHPQRIRDAVSQERRRLDDVDTLSSLNRFIRDQNPDEMMDFANYFNITLEDPN
jgi:hypothetical protein